MEAEHASPPTAPAKMNFRFSSVFQFLPVPWNFTFMALKAAEPTLNTASPRR